MDWAEKAPGEDIVEVYQKDRRAVLGIFADAMAEALTAGLPDNAIDTMGRSLGWEGLTAYVHSLDGDEARGLPHVQSGLPCPAAPTPDPLP